MNIWITKHDDVWHQIVQQAPTVVPSEGRSSVPSMVTCTEANTLVLNGVQTPCIELPNEGIYCI